MVTHQVQKKNTLTRSQYVQEDLFCFLHDYIVCSRFRKKEKRKVNMLQIILWLNKCMLRNEDWDSHNCGLLVTFYY